MTGCLLDSAEIRFLVLGLVKVLPGMRFINNSMLFGAPGYLTVIAKAAISANWLISIPREKLSFTPVSIIFFGQFPGQKFLKFFTRQFLK